MQSAQEGQTWRRECTSFQWWIFGVSSLLPYLGECSHPLLPGSLCLKSQHLPCATCKRHIYLTACPRKGRVQLLLSRSQLWHSWNTMRTKLVLNEWPDSWFHVDTEDKEGVTSRKAYFHSTQGKWRQPKSPPSEFYFTRSLLKLVTTAGEWKPALSSLQFTDSGIIPF